ncbi:hypothetical protein IAU60_001898 [Kwoniella sp. DSM 27419]
MAPSAPPDPGRRPLSKGSACEGCKSRKIRCGAEKPACVNCLKHGKQCNYPSPKHSPARLVGDRDSATRTFPPGTTQVPGLSPAPPRSSSGGRDDPLGIWEPIDIPGFTPALTLAQDTPVPAPPRPPQPFLSFHPNAGAEGDQEPPAYWDDLDFSWILASDGNDATPDSQASLPPFDAAAQQHCIWLYFTNQTSSGLEMNIARFYERLASPSMVDQPHPALLNAIYLMVCGASPLEAVRRREDEFLNAAESAINAAFKDVRQLSMFMLDITRAATLLAEWLWTRAREAEATVMSSNACRISIAASFDQIPSSHELVLPRILRLRRRRAAHVPPPRDHVEVAERIYAFWSVVLLDTCASIATTIPAVLDLSSVTTPLPMPWSMYGVVPELADRRLDDLFHENAPVTHGYIIQATILLHAAASRVLDDRSPVDSKMARLGAQRQARTYGGAPSLARGRTAEELAEAVERFVRDIPVRLKWKPSLDAEPQSPAAAVTLHFILCATRICLVDSNSYDVPNDAAMYHVRRMVDSIRLLRPADTACLSMSIFLLWTMAGQILMREVKRLRRQGDEFGAMALYTDFTQLLEALKAVGQSYDLLREEHTGLLQLLEAPASDVDPEEDIMRNGETPASRAGADGSAGGASYTSVPS